MDVKSNLETTPEKALIASYIIKLLNRNASSKVDRLLKKDYDEIKRDPLILDTILRSQLMAFFSSVGSIALTKELMKYYREYKLFSALLDAKNVLVICSKENINESDLPFNSSMTKVVLNLINSEKSYIVKSHIKAALASCILTGNLGEDFSNLMEGRLKDLGLDEEIEKLLIYTSKECQKEIKDRILESKPINQR
jgi:hypothetical protein